MTVIWPCQHSVRTFGVPPGHGKERYKVVSLMQCTTYAASAPNGSSLHVRKFNKGVRRDRWGFMLCRFGNQHKETQVGPFE